MPLSDAQRLTLDSLIRGGGAAACEWQMNRTLDAMLRDGLIEKARGKQRYRITTKGREAVEREWASVERRRSPSRQALPRREYVP